MLLYALEMMNYLGLKRLSCFSFCDGWILMVMQFMLLAAK